MQTKKQDGRQPSVSNEGALLSQEQLEEYLEHQEVVELPDREAITIVDTRSGLPIALAGAAGLLK